MSTQRITAQFDSSIIGETTQIFLIISSGCDDDSSVDDWSDTCADTCFSCRNHKRSFNILNKKKSRMENSRQCMEC